MRYLSVCSGIEAATAAWHPLGWQAQGFAEIEPFPCALLSHYYPNVPNLGDMTRFKEWPDAAPDVLVGGTPCQSFSVAGLRKGLADPRGNLLLTYLAIAARYRPRWLVWENVPGVLSDRTGGFGALLGGLAELGYGWAYRVLDAQFFRVAQRRRRVFVVASARGWGSAGAVLFERAGLSWDPPPSRESRERVAPSLAARTRGGGGLGTDAELDGALIAHALRGEGFDASEDGTGRGIPLVPEVSLCLNAGAMGRIDGESETMIPIAFNARQDPDAWADRTGPLDVDGWSQAVAVALRGREGGGTAELGGDASNALRASQGGGDKPHILTCMRVRRLTPRECERLQGFPDDFTLVPYRGKPAKDGPRYKALGNSMAVPVMRWIGNRIALVEEVHRLALAA